MRKLSWHTIGSIVLTLLLVLCIAYQFLRSGYINHCVENWCNKDFVNYTGRCTSVFYNNGIHFADRYSFGVFSDNEQFLTGQGWHFALENGDSYYIPLTLCGEASFVGKEPLLDLEGQEISVRCLPAAGFLHCNLIVSLEHENTVLLSNEVSLSYLQRANQQAVSSTLYIFCPIAVLFAAFTVVFIWWDIAEYRSKKKKQQIKQEKTNQLREEGKLHPKKQLQKKMKKP